MKHFDPSSFASLDQILDLTAEEYFRLLHPEESRGRATVLCKLGDDEVENHSFEHDALIMQMPLFVDLTSFVTLNRFWRGRKGKSLAALNALYVDLDFFNRPRWKGKSPDNVQAAYSKQLLTAGLPHPSIFLQTGRGIAAIWLIEEMPVSALKRWQAAMTALIELSAPFGADRACKDASRVFRLPGTVNEKSGGLVRVSGGTGQRHRFDALSDQIFTASGRPTRSDLEQRRKQKKAKSENGKSMPRGLTQAQRFRLILDDLEIIRCFHGGTIPTGMRNTWLHFFATCFTHLPDVLDIERRIWEAAKTATPGLPPAEVQAITRQTAEKAALNRSTSVLSDGRYHYKGATIAERLGVTSDMARNLGLKQVIPENERKRRKAEAERRRRAAKGAMTREEYLAQNNASREKPWQALGIGRTKYYELKREGLLPELTTA